MGRDQDLRDQGWKRQATYDEPRLGEMVEMYEELGFEVRVEPFEAEENEACSVCMHEAPERFQTIYTRKQQEDA